MSLVLHVHLLDCINEVLIKIHKNITFYMSGNIIVSIAFECVNFWFLYNLPAGNQQSKMALNLFVKICIEH